MCCASGSLLSCKTWNVYSANHSLSLTWSRPADWPVISQPGWRPQRPTALSPRRKTPTCPRPCQEHRRHFANNTPLAYRCTEPGTTENAMFTRCCLGHFTGASHVFIPCSFTETQQVRVTEVKLSIAMAQATEIGMQNTQRCSDMC